MQQVSTLQRLPPPSRNGGGEAPPNTAKYQGGPTLRTLLALLSRRWRRRLEHLVARGSRKGKRQVPPGGDCCANCHRRPAACGDLKAENLLLEADRNITIANSGFSNKFTFSNKLDTFCGRAPKLPSALPGENRRSHPTHTARHSPAFRGPELKELGCRDRAGYTTFPSSPWKVETRLRNCPFPSQEEAGGGYWEGSTDCCGSRI
ncbi:MAP/microtubule affinity-regulating kinase 4-like [Canis lupus familiaris]|uniref:MAP/microtubule affinity-regulating kinase 4-like n=1 Tax=Canis lupus familiaris TaxID=9615 RepID=UPI00004A6E30|nr:MAP/microtubule affinity-regulating kinase 4-like [Canis lupus familiaris]XP_038316374.1 MAP/microtubule affinity-regulating kinase 4-like [Canis lupus familiaris]